MADKEQILAQLNNIQANVDERAKEADVLTAELEAAAAAGDEARVQEITAKLQGVMDELQQLQAEAVALAAQVGEEDS